MGLNPCSTRELRPGCGGAYLAGASALGASAFAAAFLAWVFLAWWRAFRTTLWPFL
jgi:hypothetical protein